MSFEKKIEEEKRARMYDADLRWKHLQETIRWVEANLPEERRRNTRRACLENQAKHLKNARRIEH
jgi:hypothetical protein